LEEYKWIGGMWGLGFPIKYKEREKRERRRPEKRTQLHPFLLYLKLYSPLFYSLVFQ